MRFRSVYPEAQSAEGSPVRFAEWLLHRRSFRLPLALLGVGVRIKFPALPSDARVPPRRCVAAR